MTTWSWVILIGAIIVLVAVAFFWYQFRRARESFKSIDTSKLRDWDKDGWDDY